MALGIADQHLAQSEYPVVTGGPRVAETSTVVRAVLSEPAEHWVARVDPVGDQILDENALLARQGDSVAVLFRADR